MERIQGFKDLLVWQKSMDLTMCVYEIVQFFPKSETYALSDQIRRAAVSIPSNIAEGQARQTKKEFLQFLWIARGSRAEMETQILIAQKLGYLQNVPEGKLHALFSLSDEVARMLYALIAKLSQQE